MNLIKYQIELFNRKARDKYTNALCSLRNEKTAYWFQSILDTKIVPQLIQIGFDSEFIRPLFQIAIHSWQQEMGWTVDECLWIHPGLTRNIEEVRKGIMDKNEKNNIYINMENMSSQEIYDYIKRSMAPEKLTSLLDDIHTSWIILPRAYSLLKQKNGCCLISYLKYLKKEKDPSFKKILIRIITEFIANYSLKYASAKHSPMGEA